MTPFYAILIALCFLVLCALAAFICGVIFLGRSDPARLAIIFANTRQIVALETIANHLHRQNELMVQTRAFDTFTKHLASDPFSAIG